MAPPANSIPVSRHAPRHARQAFDFSGNRTEPNDPQALDTPSVELHDSASHQEHSASDIFPLTYSNRLLRAFANDHMRSLTPVINSGNPSCAPDSVNHLHRERTISR
jgi:hypothetical protein